MKTIATNKKAHFEYFIEEKYEAGIALEGSEVKSVREGSVSLADSFVFFKGNEAYINNMYIKTYVNTSSYKPDEKRARKLLLHKAEIVKLASKVKEKGKTVVPLKIYLDKNLVKVEIALCAGKHNYDKREVIKKRDIERDVRLNTKHINR